MKTTYKYVYSVFKEKRMKGVFLTRGVACYVVEIIYMYALFLR